MEAPRWLRFALPAAVMAVLGTGVLTRPPVLVAADSPWEPPPCAGAAPPGGSPPAWWRLDGIVDEAGTLTGRRLALGVVGGPSRAVDLPPEGFASGPVGAVVLAGGDDGSRSRVALVDVERACARWLPDEAAVVRSALLTPDGSSVIQHRVDRQSRADLGVWRVPVAGGRPQRILEGISPDARYGPTFTTELRLAADGRVVATSCGAERCRTRILDAGGRATSVGPTGPVLGLADDGALIAFAPCGGFPCAIVRHGPSGHETLVDAAGPATMAGDRVVFETGAGRSAALDAAGGRLRLVDAAEGLRPVPDGSGAVAGATHDGDAVLLAPDGRVDGHGLRAIEDDPAATVEEIVP